MEARTRIQPAKVGRSAKIMETTSLQGENQGMSLKRTWDDQQPSRMATSHQAHFQSIRGTLCLCHLLENRNSLVAWHKIDFNPLQDPGAKTIWSNYQMGQKKYQNIKTGHN
jgi:hypothetical protein